MPKTCTVLLDETTFVIPALNLDQLERVGELTETAGRARSMFGILRIALERAEPKMVDAATFSPTPDQIRGAIIEIMKMSGLEEGNAPGAPGAPGPT